MRAAVYDEPGGPDVFRYDEVPDPVLRAGTVLVRIEAIGVQGGDLLHRQSAVPTTRPHIVGYQAAGVIEAVGDGLSTPQVGQRVVATMNSGSHAELAVVPAAVVWVVPDGMAAEVAACIPIEFGTADDCLFEFGHLRAGETVLVQAGAGGVGLAAIQLAKAAGATVIATASSDDRLERLRDFGMDHGVNYGRDDVVAAVLELTNRRGADLVVDPVGGRTLDASIGALAYRGRVSWVGMAGRDPHRGDLWPLMERNASLTGVYLGAEMNRNGTRTHVMIERLIDRVAAGELRGVIDRSFPLSAAAEAHRYIESRRAFGRVVLTP